MAKSSIALAELVEKGAKDDIVRELLTQIVARLRTLKSSCAPVPNTVSALPIVPIAATAIAIDLRIPKPQRGTYFPGFLEPRRTAERALVAAKK